MVISFQDQTVRIIMVEIAKHYFSFATPELEEIINT